MFRNYLVSAFNNLLKNKLFSLINITGLAIGLAASLMIALYVRNETSYDRHWTHAEQLYRVNTVEDTTGQNPAMVGVSSLLALAPLREFFAEDIAKAARIFTRNMEVSVADLRFSTAIPAVDPDLLDMLDFEEVSGSLAMALADPANVALDAELALQLFGDEPALGRVVTLSNQGNARDYRVTAVYRLAPGNTVIDLPALVRLDEASLLPIVRNWQIKSALTLVQLHSGSDLAAMSARMPAFVDQTVDIASLNAGPGVRPSERYGFSLQNVRDVYLDSPFESLVSAGNKSVVLAFSTIALLVLLIGCVNFTVLTTARATQRAKEVAVRKVVGGSRGQLLAQFIGESVFIVVPALVFALALVELLLPTIAARAGMALAIPYADLQTWVLLGGLLLLVAVAGGLYPALVLSQFRPAQTLKPGRPDLNPGAAGLRGALVVFQFSVSIALMIATAVIYAQVQYSSNRDPGFQREGMAVIDNLQARADVAAQRNALKQEILALPQVRGAGMSVHQPMQTQGLASIHIFFTPAGSNGAQQLLATLGVDHDFFRTYEIPLLAGRDYAVERDAPVPLFFPGATREELAGNLVVNAGAARMLGFADPEAAVGQQVVANSPDTNKVVTFTIVGVVADTQFYSLRQAPRPEVYVVMPGLASTLSVNFEGSATALRTAVEQVWRRVMGEAELTLSFVDDTMAREFAREQQEALMLVGFTSLAILIACLGLFGSAAFAVETRTKEIGIRKALGAEVRELVGMLLWQFSRPVVLANLFAWPVALWAMTQWLERFPYHLATADIVLLAAVAGLCALLIAALTVVNSTLRVASSNPLRALRYE